MNDSIRILFLEDTLTDAEIIWRQIKKDGISFTRKLVETRVDYVDALKSFDPEMIISDFALPQFNGLEALKIRNELTPSIPFILVTGSINEEVAVNCMKAGADDYIIKENLSRLGTAIKSALKNKEIIRQKDSAENLIKQERIMLRTLIDNLPAPVYILDAKGRKVIANKADVENIGYSSESEVLGKNDLELFPGEIGKRGHEDNMCVINSGIPILNREENFVNKSGDTRWLLTSKFPLCDSQGGITGLVGLGHDVTERIKTEEAIKENEEKYRALFDGANDAILILREGKFIECNETAISMFGCEGKEDIINHSPWELSPELQPDGKVSEEQVEDAVEKVLRGESQRFTWKHIKKNGDLFDAEVSLNRIILGNNVYVQSIVRDVTEKMRAEAQLILAKDKAEESDRLKTAFLHNISHEIRTPMNAIIGFTSLLGESGIDSATQNSYIEVITQSSNQLLGIVSDIIEISNIEAGITKLNNIEVNINTDITNLWNQYNREALAKGITLNCKLLLPDNKANILADGPKLTKVMSNLLNNALKFTSQGRIEFGYNVKNSFVEFYVSDTGIGIEETQFDRIFERFYQVEYSVSRKYEGTGLGLSICKAYVELMGGSIWLNSRIEKGSEFYFTIPYITADKTETDEEKSPETIKSGIKAKKTVLVVEDEENNYKLMQVLLSRHNLNILHAVNGKIAVEICKAESTIDLVFMDIKMPVMDGIEATGIIKNERPKLPVIALTAFAFGIEKDRIIRAGCDDFVPKPVKKEIIATMIKKYL
jgi:PAS domain S-box-containing protein